MRPVGARPRRAFSGALSLALLLPLAAPAGPAAAAGAPPARDAWYRPAYAREALAPAPVAPGEPPYRTQKDGSSYARSNCGPATLGMALEAHGVELPTLELRRLTHTYQGTWPGRGGTALEHMARVAEDYRLPAHGLYDVPGQVFHRWSVEEIAPQLAAGRLVIPLVRYNLLPGHEASGVRTGHYILVYAARDDGFLYHHTAYEPREEGRARWIGRAQLDAAMEPVLVPRQAVALGG